MKYYGRKIEIIKMNTKGWNAYYLDGPWATDTTPQKALARLLGKKKNSKEG